MKKALKIAMLASGIILFADAFFLSLMISLNAGLLITFFSGAVLFIYGCFFERINCITDKGFFLWLRRMFFAGLLLLVMLIAFLAVYGVSDNVTCREKAAIVLGAGIRGETPTLPLVYRLEKAAEYHEKNPDAVIVVSGGRGAGEDITEALAMERFLVKKGVPRESILKEEKSTSTYENLVFSKKLLEEYFKKHNITGSESTVIITNSFHIFRAVKTAREAGFGRTAHLHAKTPWYTLPVNYLRESAAVMKFFVLKK